MRAKKLLNLIFCTIFTFSGLTWKSGAAVRRVRRIANGTKYRHNAEFMVSLSHKPFWWFMDYEHVCGGVMISSQWVLSAAHCFFARRQVEYIGHGSKKFSKLKHYPIDFVFIPEMFEKQFDKSCVCSFQHDIAVIKTVDVMQVHSLDTLPTLNRQNLKPFSKTYLYGWGQTEDGTYADELRHTKLLLLSSMPSWYTRGEQLLNGYDSEAEGNVGDSGGPWLSLDNSRIYGIHVGQTGLYGVAVKIAYYANWIFYMMYEYRDLLPTKLPSDRIIRTSQNLNETVYQTRLSRWSSISSNGKNKATNPYTL